MATTTKVLFIDEAYMRDVLPIDTSIDSKFIVPSIMKAQENNMKQLLGTSICMKLTDLISTGLITGNTAYNTLLTQYIQINQAYWSFYYLLSFLHFKLTAKGVEKQKGNNSEPVTRAEFGDYKNEVISFADYFGERTTMYLMANPTLFPEYTNPGLLTGNSLDTVRPDQTGYNMPGGILIPNNKKSRLFGFDYPTNR